MASQEIRGRIDIDVNDDTSTKTIEDKVTTQSLSSVQSIITSTQVESSEKLSAHQIKQEVHLLEGSREKTSLVSSKAFLSSDSTPPEAHPSCTDSAQMLQDALSHKLSEALDAKQQNEAFKAELQRAIQLSLERRNEKLECLHMWDPRLAKKLQDFIEECGKVKSLFEEIKLSKINQADYKKKVMKIKHDLEKNSVNSSKMNLLWTLFMTREILKDLKWKWRL